MVFPLIWILALNVDGMADLPFRVIRITQYGYETILVIVSLMLVIVTVVFVPSLEIALEYKGVQY